MYNNLKFQICGLPNNYFFMTKIVKNIVTSGFSGKLGNELVFKQVNGQTIVASAPIKSEKDPSPAQEAQRTKFKDAAMYAKSAMQNAGIKQQYLEQARRRKHNSAFGTAVKDYFMAPEIKSIDVSQYSGAIGEKIYIKAVDDFKVTSVVVMIKDGNDTTIEEGDAIDLDGLQWEYTVLQANANLTGTKVVVTAEDLPGNKGDDQEELA